MKKEAYYFSHDSNARHDSKIVKLRRKYGMEGYGIYFAIVEMLREDSAHKRHISSFEDIAYEIQVDPSTVKSVITEYDLFVIEDDYFYSPRLTRSMKEYNELKNKRMQAGKKGAQAKDKQTSSKPQANLEQNESNSLANDNQITSEPQALKERKGKEKKGKEIKLPTVDEVVDFFKLKGYTESSARKAFAHYDVGDWYDSKGNKVKNWKQKMANVWFRDENKIPPDPKIEMDKYREMEGFAEIFHTNENYKFVIENGKIRYIHKDYKG